MGSMPTTALVAYDLLILRRGAQRAFSRRRDMLLLALAVPVAMLFAWAAAGGIADKAAELPLAVKAWLAGAIGFAVAQALAARLGHLRADSIMARHALQGGSALVHTAFWGAPPLLAALALFARGAEPALEIGALLAAFAAGAAAALSARAVGRKLGDRRTGSGAHAAVPGLEAGTRRQRIVRLLTARSGFRRAPLALNLALFAACGAMLGLLVPLRPLFAGLGALLLAGWAMRQHPPLLRYLLFLGILPDGAALVPLLPVAALAAGFAAVAASLGAAPLAWLAGGAAAFLLLLACIALLRGYHQALKSSQAAGLALQIDLVGIALAAWMVPPLAPALLAARLWMLRRAAAAMRYSLA
jgi:hypothetical protein